MALNQQRTNLAASTAQDAVSVLLNTGYIRIYDGAQPATGDTAITSQVLLAELRFASTAFGAASLGVATAGTITGDASANATGTASWFRTFKSDGTTAVYDGSVGMATADMILASTSIVAGTSVSLSTLTLGEKKTA